MKQRVEQAVNNHKKGYNCAQAVVCAYCELLGMEEDQAFRLSEGFGGGMGAMHDGTCGAVTGMYMLAGLQNSDGTEGKGSSKKETYEQVRALSQAFKVLNRTTNCGDLMGLNDPALKHECDDCIADAARLVERMLLTKE